MRQVVVLLMIAGLGKGLSVISIPLFALVLSASEMGAATVFISTMLVIAGSIGFGANTLVMREWAHLQAADYARFLTHVATFVTLLWIVIGGCLQFMLPRFLSQFGFPPIASWLVLVGALFAAMVELVQKASLAREEIRVFGVVEITRSVLLLAVAFSLIAAGVEPLAGRTVGYVIALMITAAVALRHFGASLPPRSEWSGATFRRIVSFSSRSAPQVVAHWIRLGFDRIVLAYVIGVTELGVYTVAFALSSGMLVVTTALNNHFAPRSLARYKAGNIAGVRRLRRWLLVAGLAAALLTCLVGVLIYRHLTGAEYGDGIVYLPILLVSHWLHFVYLMHAKYFVHADRVGRLGLINLVSVGVYVVLLVTLSAHVVAGAAWAHAVGSLCLSVPVYIACRRGESRIRRYAIVESTDSSRHSSMM
ncbi:MAG: hypothetical protein CMP06_09635 [Xanthomonadales bacterium]|nr:hypothetical protein [Xanthomonadales bacterium]